MWGPQPLSRQANTYPGLLQIHVSYGNSFKSDHVLWETRNQSFYYLDRRLFIIVVRSQLDLPRELR